jgi:phosphomannomutase/phosphoglucomutase
MDHYNLLPEYLERVVSDTQLGRNLKVVIDCGNGVAALVAPKLIRALGCEVIELFCEVDGQFPNHHPDPSQPENLYALIDKVLETDADLGIAFDGDGDRLGVVDSHGKIIWPDRQMMLFAADVLSREPGADILYDVKCSRNLPSQIVKSGGRPLMCKSGHAPMKIRMKETGAALAGELTGHIFFRERWYGFDDAIYASARMLEIVSNAYEETSHELFATLPDSFTTPELSITLEEGENVRLMETLIALADFPDARITTIDGLRLDFNDGFGLVRASNTLPALTFRFEGDTELAMVSIKQHIEALIRQVRPEIELPF